MKQTLKKLFSIALVTALVFALIGCGSSQNQKEDEIDGALSANMITTAEGLTKAIVSLSDEDIESYKESGDAFTESAMEVWESSRDELGEYMSTGSSEVAEITDGYTVTTKVEFSKKNADMVYTFTEEGTPSSMAVNVEYTLGEKMTQAAMNTVMGVGIVFLMLLFLSFLISLFKYVPALEAKFRGGKQEETKTPAAPAAPAAAPAPAVQAADDSELIAVIAAAIAAAEGTSTDGFVVRSIKKVNRKKW